MWEKIFIGTIVTAALYYIARRIYRSFVKGDNGACSDCAAGDVKNVPGK